MDIIRIGILSDTHLTGPSRAFQSQVDRCFGETDLILHAGDLIDLQVLQAFGTKRLHAVHGNMCTPRTCRTLPTQKTIQVGKFTIGLIHRAGNSYDFEDRLLEIFPTADCIVYGHTHQPVCHRIGGTLLINPGSFRSTGRFGAHGTYCHLEVGETLSARVQEVQPA